MIKHNFRKFKRQHFLSHVPRAQNYKYWFSKDEFDDKVKIVTPDVKMHHLKPNC